MKDIFLKRAAAAALTLLIISDVLPLNKHLYPFGGISVTANAADNENVVDLEKLSGDYKAQDGDVLTGTLSEDYSVSVADGATVTLRNAIIQYNGINCLGDATIVLDGTNSVHGTGNYPGVFIPPDNTLTINGSGTIIATGGTEGAGIGSGYNSSCGNITINGGSVTAAGGSNGAGIGSGFGGSCGTVTIDGGNVTATGGTNGAGIGSGYSGSSCGNITITGGNVTATGGENGAGIGSGCFSSSCGNITITGGNVTATGGENAAGIGCGSGGMCGKISISKTARITAKGGSSTVSAIGLATGEMCGPVTIDGDVVKITDSFYLSDNLYPTGGANAVKTADFENNMITYSAVDGYHFAPFNDIVKGGVTVHRNSRYTVVVSGKMSEFAKISVPDAIEDVNENIVEFRFEDGFPKGWTTEQSDTSGTAWKRGTGDNSEDTGAHTGEYNMKLVAPEEAIGKNYYLITPTWDLRGYKTVSIEFAYINSVKYIADEFGIYYRYLDENGKNTSWKKLYSNKNSHKNWTCDKIYLPAEAMCANVQIGFRATTHLGNGVGLDDVVFTKIPLLGDTDLDGSVTDNDAALVLKYISTGKPFFEDNVENENALAAANADCTGDIDMLDVIKILQILQISEEIGQEIS